MTETKKSLGFNIFVDEATYDALVFISNSSRFHMEEHTVEVMTNPQFLLSRDAMISLLKNLSNKGHEYGWCKDQSCSHKIIYKK